MDREELHWRQYQQNIELFKFYMDLVIKFNVFYYAVTGAIISFFFANSPLPNIKYSLLFPILYSSAFAGFFIYGANLMKILRDETFTIRDNLKLQACPDVGVLSILLYIFSGVFIVVAISCGIIIWKY